MTNICKNLFLTSYFQKTKSHIAQYKGLNLSYIDTILNIYTILNIHSLYNNKHNLKTTNLILFTRGLLKSLIILNKKFFFK